MTNPSSATNNDSSFIPLYTLPDSFNSITPSHANYNPFVEASGSLIAFINIFKKAQLPQSNEQLKTQIMQELQHFRDHLHKLNYSDTIILAAEYCLSAALDEAILGTEWAEKNNWARKTLLSTKYHETLGGEKFFLILDRILNYKASSPHLLEFLYIILSLGFVGKYYNQDKAMLQSIKYHLFQKISSTRPTVTKNKTNSKKISSKRLFWSVNNKYLASFWLMPLCAVIIVTTGYIIFEYKTSELIDPVLDRLSIIKKNVVENF